MLQDPDLLSVQEARDLVERSFSAQEEYEKYSQAQVDSAVKSIAHAAAREARRLAALAVEETGYGNEPDKVAKNLFVAKNVAEYIAPLRTIGVVSEDQEKGITEIAVPMGVVAAIVPSTNPTSTAIFKCLIALKAGNGVVVSPHPAARRCILESIRVCVAAAEESGLPPGLIACMTLPTQEATQELMRHAKTAIILATGGAGLVRAAYSSGKPAYGVGPGNVPSYIDRSADVALAVRRIMTGKTFDNGTLCSSEQSVVVDSAVEATVAEEFIKNNAYFLLPKQVSKVESIAIQANKRLNSQIVGKSAQWIAQKAGIEVPGNTRALIAPLHGVGSDHPLSCEKLSPILGYYTVEGWRQGCERCKEILAYGGMGHTLAIHCQDREIVRAFGLEKPAFRICVNTAATHGSIGLSTNLPPSLTLGCGTYGNNITTDNITPLHLVQLKRVAWESKPVEPSGEIAGYGKPNETRESEDVRETPVTPSQLASIVDEYLRTRNTASVAPPKRVEPQDETRQETPESKKATDPEPVEFVSEMDVRSALQKQKKICIGPKTIVTPAAQELGAAHEIFIRV